LSRNGEAVDPIVVRFDGQSYFVQDGFHRVEAARQCGLSQIEAEVSPGSLEDMETEFQQMLHQLKANLQRTT